MNRTDTVTTLRRVEHLMFGLTIGLLAYATTRGRDAAPSRARVLSEA